MNENERIDTPKKNRKVPRWRIQDEALNHYKRNIGRNFH